MMELKDKLKLRNLYYGLAETIQFQNNGTSSTSSKTGHKLFHHREIATTTELILPAHAESVTNDRLQQDDLDVESSFLYEVVKKRKRSITFNSERDIQSFVKLYLENILRLIGIDECVEVDTDNAFCSNHHGIWLVRNVSTGLPLLVCLVTCPNDDDDDEANALHNLRIHGHLFDCMSQLRHMYGQNQVFGILTTLQEWRICCLKDTLSFAESLELYPSTTSMTITDNHPDSQREYCTSRIISLNDIHLGKWIILYLMKAKNATFGEVSLLSGYKYCLQTCAIITNDSTTAWKQVHFETVKLKMPDARTKVFNIVRYLPSGADGNVLLAISDKGVLCVLKVHYRDEDRNAELNNWKLINDQNCFRITITGGRQAMVMPLVFHVTSTSSNNGSREINFNLVEWCKESFVTRVSISDSHALDRWTEKLLKKWQELGWTIEQVAIEATTKLALAGYCHDDLKWNHIGVIPIIVNDEVHSFQPILIDLVRVSEGLTFQQAKSRMNESLMNLGISSDLLHTEYKA